MRVFGAGGLRALARRPGGEAFVMTSALCEGAPREEEAWRHVVELAAARDVPLVPVVPEARADEMMRRVGSADRVGKKLTDAGVLRDMMAEARIRRPLSPFGLVLDVSDLAPERAAAVIEQHVGRCVAG